MIPDGVLLVSAIATVPAVVLDMTSGWIQRRQVQTGGGEPVQTLGIFTRVTLSFGLNAVFIGGCAYLYFRLWAGTGGAYLFGAVAWLLLTIPALLLSRAMDESQQRVVTLRALSLFVKAAALSIALAYFIG